ncbi:hypothetical protein SESBI_12969 [Sesbania bispinosa]|nr:hypothetical protein SESBI_12969 [Sesbania bispinosa]
MSGSGGLSRDRGNVGQEKLRKDAYKRALGDWGQDRSDGHAGNGEENSETTPETNNPILQRILQRMDQLQEQNQTLQEQNQTLQTQVTTIAHKRAEEEMPEVDTGEFHPFSTEIANVPYPTDFREPPLKDYDGTTDPQAHVTAFKTQMLKRGIEDAIQCKLFSGTLSGAAMICEQMSRCGTTSDVSTIASLLVLNPNPELLVSAFEEGLQPGQFNESLAQRPAQSMQEIRNRVDCYIKGEGEQRREEGEVDQRRLECVENGKEQGQTYQQHGRARKGYDHRGRNFTTKSNWADYQCPEPASNFGLATMTPLNTTRARILREVYQSDLIRLPPQAEGPKGPDMNKWCDYHRARGHDTENCWTLMNRIERLIKEGYLGRYVEKRKDRDDRRRDEGGSGLKRRRDDRHKEGKGKDEVKEWFSDGHCRDSLKVRRRNWPDPQPKEESQHKITKSSSQSSIQRGISLKEGPQPTEELEEVQ